MLYLHLSKSIYFNMLKTKLALIVGLLSLTSYGQDNPKLNETYRVSKPFPTSNASIIPLDGKILLSNSSKKEYQYSLATGNNYNITKSNSGAQTPIGKTEKHFENAQIGNKYYKFIYDLDKKTGAFEIFTYEINTENLTISKDKKSVIKATNAKLDKELKASIMYINISAATLNIWTMPSQDKSKLHILYYNEDNETSRQLQVITIDENLEVLNNRSYKLNPTNKKDETFDKFKVGYDGNIYNLRHVRFMENKTRYSRLQLEILNPEEGAVTLPIEIKKGDMKSCSIHASPEANIIVAGTYLDGTENGMFAMDCMEGEFGEISYLPIPLDLIKKYKSEKQIEGIESNIAKNKNVLPFLQISHAGATADGSIILTAEIQYEIRKTDSRGNVSITYVLEEAFTGAMDKDGNELWINKIPKRSASAYGADTFFDDNETHQIIIYLDDYRNEKLEENQNPHTMQSNLPGMVVAYTIDKKTGEMERHALFNMKDVDGKEVYNFIKNKLYKTGKNEYTIKLYYKNKEDVFVTSIVPM